MKPILLKFRNHEIPVYCDEKEKILSLSNKLNQKVEESYQSHNLSDIKRLYLTALSILEELESTKVASENLQEANTSEVTNSLADIAQQIRVLVNTLEQ